MNNNKMLPFKTSVLSKKIVNISKEYLNSCFELKQHEYESGHKFDFDTSVRTMSRALAVLMIEHEITREQGEAIVKFLSSEIRERSYT